MSLKQAMDCQLRRPIYLFTLLSKVVESDGSETREAVRKGKIYNSEKVRC